MPTKSVALFRSVLAGTFLLIGTFVLPYLAPVNPSVSVSYIVNFNNAVAALLFAVGALLFAYLSPWPQPKEQKDSLLSPRYLLAGVGAVSFLCLVQVYGLHVHPPGLEVFYNLDRLNKLAAGQHLYQEFEYPYGPLMLYGPLWFSRAAHVSLLNGYYGFWTLEWAVGIALLWYAVRWIAVPTPYRGLVFSVLCAVQIQSVANEGISYTPIRIIGAAGLVVFVHRIWLRTLDGWRTAGAAVLVGILGLAVAPELGLSLLLGLGVWICLLTCRSEVSIGQFATFFLASGACCATAVYQGLFVTMRAFSGGAYCFPLVISGAVLIILSLYVLSICAAVAEVRNGRWQSQMIPLVTVLLIALPAAFARCDLGHLQFAATGIVLGLCLTRTMPGYGRWAWNLLAVITFGFSIAYNDARIAWHGIHAAWSRGEPASVPASPPLHTEANFSPGKYFSPILWPFGTSLTPGVHIETGYYGGMVNVFTPDAISRKLLELQAHSRMPLILSDTSLEDQFTAFETDPSVVRSVEKGWYVPKIQHAPVTYQPLIDFIRSHYRPGASANEFRVWAPIADSR